VLLRASMTLQSKSFLSPCSCWMTTMRPSALGSTGDLLRMRIADPAGDLESGAGATPALARAFPAKRGSASVCHPGPCQLGSAFWQLSLREGSKPSHAVQLLW
jgi:hypothetical protein